MSELRGWKLVGASGYALMGAVLLAAAPAQAQDSAEVRLRKIEAEVKALQRQVFPGGDAALFPGAAGTSTTAATGTPATSALTDVLTRMDAMEAQNARLTAQVEELSNKLRLAEAAKTSGASGAASAAAVAANVAAAGAVSEPVKLVPEAAPKPVVAKVEPKPVAVAPPPSRVAAVKAIAKPSTGEAGEDEYTYGYKLWEAKFFPEAQQQLKLFLDKYPKHKRETYARNLLGRAYLDDGKPREAAPWFLQNYQANKKGERAADSLLYLADSMVAMKDTNRACIALGEFADGYPAEAAGRLRGAYLGVRAKVACN
jgi:TolA-binding protein